MKLTGCTFGECVQQYVIDEALGVLSTIADSSGLSGGVIAGLAVVGVILLALVGLIIWGFIMQRKAKRNMVTDGTLPKSGGVGVTWSGVGYEIKAARHPWERAVVWLKGSGSTTISKEDGEMVGPNGGKIVLKDSCGEIVPGGLVCILGPSGAGKSTLVDILAGKRKAGQVEGQVGFTHKEGRKVKIGYVDQVGLESRNDDID